MSTQAARHVSKSRPKLKRLIGGIVFSVVLAASSLFLGDHDLLFVDTDDKYLGDWYFALLSDRALEQRRDIAVILIIEETLLDYNPRTPIDRGLIADILRVVDKTEPAAIGLDFIFDRKTLEDSELLTAIHETKSQVVIGSIDQRDENLPDQNFQIQKEFLIAANRPVGHILFEHKMQQLTVGDETIRLIAPPFDSDWSQSSFSERLAKIQSSGNSGSRTISWLLPPKNSRVTTFLTLNIPRHNPEERSRFLTNLLPRNFKEMLAGRTVLIGADLRDGDQHITPLSILDGKRLPGVVVHAHALAQLKDGNREIRELSSFQNVFIISSIAFLCFFAGRNINTKLYQEYYKWFGLALFGLISVLAFRYWANHLTVRADVVCLVVQRRIWTL